MNANFEKALALVLEHEGGYVNHPSDPGGMTNLGVTKRVWEEWVGHEVDEKTMRGLTPEIVGPMYKAKYWDKVKGDDLPAGVDYCVFDAAINSGPGRAAKWLQAAVGVDPDGGIGPKTLQAVAGMDANELKRVKELEAENSKLKRMYADLALMNEALKDVIEKKF